MPTLTTTHRLKSRKAIASLFRPGTASVSSYPIRINHGVAAEARGTAPFQVTFVVPKRKFKRATDRNRIKRQLREAFRLRQELLAPHPAGQRILIVMFTGKEEPDFAYLERKMTKLLRQISASSSPPTPPPPATPATDSPSTSV